MPSNQNFFLDTSFLVSRFTNEGEASQKAVETYSEIQNATQTSHIYIGVLNYVEFRSAIWKKVRQGHLSREEAPNVFHAVELATAEYYKVGLTEREYYQAAQLLDVHAERGWRTLDALQLVSAMSVRESQGAGLIRFLTLDTRLRECALAEGFDVLPQ